MAQRHPTIGRTVRLLRSIRLNHLFLHLSSTCQGNQWSIPTTSRMDRCLDVRTTMLDGLIEGFGEGLNTDGWRQLQGWTAEDLEERRIAMEADVGESHSFHLQYWKQQPYRNITPSHVILTHVFKQDNPSIIDLTLRLSSKMRTPTVQSLR